MNAETGPESFDAYLQQQLSHADKRRTTMSNPHAYGSDRDFWAYEAKHAKPAGQASRQFLPDEPANQAVPERTTDLRRMRTLSVKATDLQSDTAEKIHRSGLIDIDTASWTDGDIREAQALLSAAFTALTET